MLNQQVLLLRGVAAKHDMAWIYKWVHNSSEMIKSGDAVAVKFFEENNKSVMTSFPQLSTGDIDNIIAYTSEVKAEPAAGAPGAVATWRLKLKEVEFQIILF